MSKLDYSLYLVSDSSLFADTKQFLAAIKQALAAGVTLVQLREKSCSTLDFYNLAIKMRDLTGQYNVPLIINDRVDIALAVEAEGVHLGQSDLPAHKVRQLTQADFIIGVSAKNSAQATEAQACGANYLGVGAIFPTTTKVLTTNTSITTLKTIVQATTIPVVAIGGLNINNMSVLKHTGIEGIAVVSAILKAKDITGTVQCLKEELTRIKNNL